MAEAPKEDTLEINLFGGGSAYGECILCHLGFDKWIVVDSFNDPYTRNSIVYEYFNSIGKNLSQIQLIVATHWHDDHIKGISQLYKKANCRLIISQALSKKQMSRLISLNEYKNSKNSGLVEFSEVVQYSIDKNKSLGRAIQDRVIFHETSNENFSVKLTSLSPSDKSIAVFEEEMREILNDAYDLNLTTRKINPNLSSVVLLLEVNEHKILLGADMELHIDKEMGWGGIMNSLTLPKDKSVNVFKVPHHGSENGHHDEIWTTVLTTQNKIAILTPYGRGRKKLPSKQDKERILQNSEKSFITSKNLSSTKPKKRDKKVSKILKELSYVVKERKYTYGHIQLRKNIHLQNNKWTVDLFGNACKLSELTH